MISGEVATNIPNSGYWSIKVTQLRVTVASRRLRYGNPNLKTTTGKPRQI